MGFSRFLGYLFDMLILFVNSDLFLFIIGGLAFCTLILIFQFLHYVLRLNS